MLIGIMYYIMKVVGIQVDWLLEYNVTGIYFILWVICEVSETGIQELFYSLPILIYHSFESSCLLESMGHWVQVGPWTVGGNLSLNWFTAFFSESSMWPVSICQET